MLIPVMIELLCLNMLVSGNGIDYFMYNICDNMYITCNIYNTCDHYIGWKHLMTDYDAWVTIDCTIAYLYPSISDPL